MQITASAESECAAAAKAEYFAKGPTE